MAICVKNSVPLLIINFLLIVMISFSTVSFFDNNNDNEQNSPELLQNKFIDKNLFNSDEFEDDFEQHNNFSHHTALFTNKNVHVKNFFPLPNVLSSSYSYFFPAYRGPPAA